MTRPNFIEKSFTCGSTTEISWIFSPLKVAAIRWGFFRSSIIRPWSRFLICDRLWENPAYGIFYENRVWSIFDKLYHRANHCSGFRLIACFAVELQRFVCNHATPPTIEKLRSKGIAMHAYGVSVYYAYTGSQLNGPGWSRSKWTQRSSEGRISSSITRAASSMPKKLKRLVNVR